jgi:hypothetical protein
MRENSTWSRLSTEQREKVEGWLFEENLGYAKILERVKAEFGIEATKTSLCRYYRRRVVERQAEELVEAQFSADALNGLDGNSRRNAALKLVGKVALRVDREKPEEIEQLASLTGYLLRAEQNDLRRGRLQFGQRCVGHGATLATKEIPRACPEAVQDDTSLEQRREDQEGRGHALPLGKGSEIREGE